MADELVVGKLRAILGLDTAQYEAGARKAAAANAKLTTDMRQMSSVISARMVGLGAAVGTFLGAFAGQAVRSAISALTNIGRQAIKTAGDLVDMSERTGISIEALQRMDYVAGQTGSTLEQFTKAAFQLGARLNGNSNSVTDAVDDLGLSLTELRAMRPEDQFATVLEALGKIDDAGRRNEIGLRLFGKAVQSVLPAAAEGYKKLAAEARAASAAQVQAIDKAADALERLKKQIATGAVQLGGTFALGLEALEKMTAMERMQAFLSEGAIGAVMSRGEARARVLAFQANEQKKLEGATKSATAAEVNYAKQLAAVSAELSKLTPEQRRQIDAARELGISLDDIEDQLGLTPGLLRLYADGTKDSRQATKELNEELEKLSHERSEEFQRAMAKDAEAIKKFQDQAFAIDSARIAEQNRLNEEGAAEIRSAAQADVEAKRRFQDEAFRLASETTKKKMDSEAEYRSFQNMLGERATEDERARMDARQRISAAEIASTTAMTLDSLAMLRSESKGLAIAAKAGAIAAAIMNTYEGATKALAKLPPPFSFFAMGATIAAGLAQVAIIKKTPVGYREGTRDLDFQNFGSRTPTELHGQEAVIPRGSGHRLAGEIAVSLRNQFAGFARPGGQAALVHAGSRGGVTMSPGRIGGQTHIHNHVTIHALDAADFDHLIDHKLIPKLNTAAYRNTGGYATEHRKGFGINPGAR